MTEYDLEYQRCDAACGDPFPEFVALFKALPVNSSVLDRIVHMFKENSFKRRPPMGRAPAAN